MSDETFGARIGHVIANELRQRGWSQGQLAAKAGLSQPVVSDIVSGKTKNPRSSTLTQLAGALGISVGQIIELAGPHESLRVSGMPSQELYEVLDAQIAYLQKRVATLEVQIKQQASDAAVTGSRLKPGAIADALHLLRGEIAEVLRVAEQARETAEEAKRLAARRGRKSA